MRKILFSFAVLGILLTMSNCNGEVGLGGVEVNPFVGTWGNPENSFQYIITEINFTCRLANGDIYYTGAYTYDDTYITIIVDTNHFPLIGPIVIYPYAFNEQGILSLDGGQSFTIRIH